MKRDLRRNCIHEAGHFYLAFKYNPHRAFSICISRQVKTDLYTVLKYVSAGEVVTVDPEGSLPSVQVSIHAAGLAAESIVYGESYETLMQDSAMQFSIKTDTDHAKETLGKAGLPVTSEEEFISFYWRVGFDHAVNMMSSFQDNLQRRADDELHRIANYCLENLDRIILRDEIVTNCGLY